jgi:hypothetical protein
MKDIKIVNELVLEINNFAKLKKYTPNKLIKRIHNIFKPLGGITGYNIKKDLSFTLYSKEDAYSLSFFEENNQSKKANQKKWTFLELLRNDLKKKGVPIKDLESHLGSGKKESFEYSSSKHHNYHSSPLEELNIEKIILGSINAISSSDKVKNYLEAKLANIEVLEFLEFNKDPNNNITINATKLIEYVHDSLKTYSEIKGDKSISLTLDTPNNLKTRTEELEIQLKELYKNLKDKEVSVPESTPETKTHTNQIYKLTSNPEILGKNLLFNAKRYNLKSKNLTKGFEKIQLQQIKTVFDEISGKVINLKIYSETDEISKAKEEYAKIPDKKTQEEVLKYLHKDVKDMQEEYWEKTRKIVDDYETLRNNLDTFHMPVIISLSKQPITLNYTFPILSEDDSILKKHFEEEFNKFTSKLNTRNRKYASINLRNKYLSVQIDHKIDKELLFQELANTLDSISDSTGIEFDTIDSEIENFSEEFIPSKVLLKTKSKTEKKNKQSKINIPKDEYIKSLEEKLRGFDNTDAEQIYKTIVERNYTLKDPNRVKIIYDLIFDKLEEGYKKLGINFTKDSNLKDAIYLHPFYNRGKENSIRTICNLLRFTEKKIKRNIELIEENGKTIAELPLTYLECNESKLLDKISNTKY